MAVCARRSFPPRTIPKSLNFSGGLIFVPSPDRIEVRPFCCKNSDEGIAPDLPLALTEPHIMHNVSSLPWFSYVHLLQVQTKDGSLEIKAGGGSRLMLGRTRFSRSLRASKSIYRTIIDSLVLSNRHSRTRKELTSISSNSFISKLRNLKLHFVIGRGVAQSRRARARDRTGGPWRRRRSGPG
jgi:hypothetical protein